MTSPMKTNPLRILQVVIGVDRVLGGLSLFVAELSAELADQGHHVQIICGPGGAKEPWPTGAARTLACSPDSKEWNSAFDTADIIHVHGLWLPFYHRALVSARRRKKPHLLSTHGMMEAGALRFSRWKKQLALTLYQRRDLKLAPVLHATAEPEWRTLRDFGLGQPIVTLPPGVRLPVLSPPAPAGGASRRALFLGRIHGKKGILDLIEAWSVVRPAHWKLDLAGPDEGGYLQKVRRAIEERGLGKDVFYHGPAFGPAKEKLLRSSSLLVVPSISENFGIVVAEGLAYGLPVITTQGTPWQVLEREDCGWWVPAQAPALVKALEAAMHLSPEKLVQKGRRGRLLAERDFGWPRIAGQMAEVYAWLLEKKEKPKCVR
jgi:glycosyltransferase involved in cell wall biosynthesis